MSSNLESVLVVGGCGFLGYHIVQRLIEAGNIKVSVLDLDVSRNRIDGVSYTADDICSKKGMEAVLDKERPQVIIHTASPLAQSQLSLETYQRVNVDGTRTILEAAASHPSVRAMVYTSSASVVHDFVSDLIDADESLPVLRLPEQHDAYAHTKGIADSLIRTANKQETLLTCCLRPSGLFGERDSGTLVNMIENAKNGKTRFQIGDGKNRWDFTYVGNAADAHILAAETLVQEANSKSDAHYRVAGEAFFITNGEPRSFWQFAREIGSAAGYPTAMESVYTIPAPLGLLIGSLSDWMAWAFSLGQRRAKIGRFEINLSRLTRTYRIDKAEKQLSYKPRISLDEGIRCSGLWWQTEMEKEEKKSL
ncbi:MAG: hypothetical protein GOMPHAMPRED_002712 [Gomphillus americanus]|uniref:3-beta hydroxysteroid dehydrogenase/isomerase domain-containing protein n=1 Tax=Gomphillus americanus TaxID=1940652 RepID=A0A8H3FL67_9LECA|nr:MAG: hypothetical protein GOMPHAMPRED_002712 [Gomphillus americanus]